eukprot:CAMPEP_0119492448 /NCGR_PEP_ID=MMETSP1344-20130328/16996_1 /TAXON_ID=236787 /ORGANISM="Florenciella parvula, Strain CCMP2471" /LENGTH=1338 /DNA_ID=CAMNT_0007527779 /DNA_START=20 /DNA_END=4033 /DNA_ORIENTATION=+
MAVPAALRWREITPAQACEPSVNMDSRPGRRGRPETAPALMAKPAGKRGASRGGSRSRSRSKSRQNATRSESKKDRSPSPTMTGWAEPVAAAASKGGPGPREEVDDVFSMTTGQLRRRASSANKRPRPQSSSSSAQPSSIQRPASPFPKALLFKQFSDNPLETLDLRNWSEHIHPAELSGMMRINELWNQVMLAGCAGLNDERMMVMSETAGHRIMSLDLSGTAISDLAVRNVSQHCTVLTELCLKDCTRLTDRSLRALSANSAGTLQKLSLENCRALGDHAFVSMISQCTTIHDLDLSGTLLSDRSFSQAGEKLDITRMGLNRCPKLTDEGLKLLLGSCTRLTALTLLDASRLSDGSMQALIEVPVIGGMLKPHAGCHQLKQFELSGAVGVSDALVKYIRRACPDIKKLRINGCPGVGEDGAMNLIGDCKQLAELQVADTPLVTDLGVIGFCSGHRQKLISLDLSMCVNVGDEGVRAIARSCRNLLALDISYITDTSDTSVLSVGKYLTKLNTLKLAGLRNVTDRGIGGMSKRCRKLTELDVSGCVQFTSRAMRDVASMRDLHTLNISSCPLMGNSVFKSIPRRAQHLIARDLPRINDDGMHNLVNCTRDLVSLDLADCPQITGAAVAELVGKYVNMTSLDTTGCEAVDSVELHKITKDHPYLRVKMPSSPRQGNEAEAKAGGPQASGLCYTPETAAHKVRTDYARDMAAFDAATHVVQQKYHEILEKREVTRHKRASRAGRNKCAFKIQKGWAWYQAGKRTRSVRQQRAAMAMVIQAAWQLKVLKRKWQKAKEHRKLQVWSQYLFAWADYVGEQRRFLNEEPDEWKSQLAREHFMGILTRRTFHHLREVLLKTAEIDAKKKLAADMWEKVILPRLWQRWSYRAACLAQYRRGLVRVFLHATDLDTHNSLKQKPRVAISHAYERAVLLSWIWIGIREFAKDIIKNREQTEKALKFAMSKFFAGAMRHIFTVMRDYSVARRTKRNRKARGTLYYRERKLRAGLLTLAGVAAANADFKRRCKQAAQMWKMGSVKHCFHDWQHYTRERIRKRKARERGHTHWERRMQLVNMRQWHANVLYNEEQRQRFHKMVKVARHFMNGQQEKMCFKAWKFLWECAKNQQSVAEVQGNAKLVHKMFDLWVKFKNHCLLEKQKKREEDFRIAYHATKIQAKWRSRKSRIKEEEWESFQEWGALKIQAQFRMKQAQKIKQQLIRHRDLRFVIKEEFERDDMQAEDDAAHAYVHAEKTSTRLVAFVRGCLTRIWMVDYRHEYALERQKRWREEQEEALREAVRKQKQREIQKKLEAKMALEVQRYFRGMRGRRRYKFILHYKIECDAASML